MMRWRCFARTTIIVVGVACAFTASAAGFLLGGGVIDLSALGEAGRILAWMFAVVMGLFGFATAFNKLLVMPVIAQMRAEQKELISLGLIEIAKGFESLIDRHITANDPHPTASDRMHEPLYEADQQILRELADMKRLREIDSRRLNALVRAHNAAMTTQQAAIDSLGCMAHRDPHKTPFPRRDSDPDGSDFSDLRGHARKDPMIVDEEDEP